MAVGFLYVGDPFSALSTKIGPLTMAGRDVITLQNLTGHPITAGTNPTYVVPNGKYLNQQSAGSETGRAYGVLGVADVAGPWEKWRLSGAVVVAWNGESYAFAVVP